MALVLVVAGCATPPPRPIPLSQADVISMTKAGLSDDDIIRRIDATFSVFRLSSADVVRLRNAGVSERVVNHMLDTYTRAAVIEQQHRDYYDWEWGYGSYYRHPYWW